MFQWQSCFYQTNKANETHTHLQTYSHTLIHSYAKLSSSFSLYLFCYLVRHLQRNGTLLTRATEMESGKRRKNDKKKIAICAPMQKIDFYVILLSHDKDMSDFLRCFIFFLFSFTSFTFCDLWAMRSHQLLSPRQREWERKSSFCFDCHIILITFGLWFMTSRHRWRWR